MSYIMGINAGFESGNESIQTELEESLVRLQEDPSDPVLLAQFQALVSEKTVYTSLLSNTIQWIKSSDTQIISNISR
jgi:type III secretion protein F